MIGILPVTHFIFQTGKYVTMVRIHSLNRFLSDLGIKFMNTPYLAIDNVNNSLPILNISNRNFIIIFLLQVRFHNEF